jgi:hypothetical protein
VNVQDGRMIGRPEKGNFSNRDPGRYAGKIHANRRPVVEPKARSLSMCLLLLTLAIPAACERFNTTRAVPVDPITGILDAFQSHNVVALGEGLHGNAQGHAFRLALIRDPRFPTIVDDIVVEFGNARYQALMDRFVQGEEVPYPEKFCAAHLPKEP